MPFMKCGIGGCSRRLQPILKVDPRDRETWLYPECEECGRLACEEHSSHFEGRIVCDSCRRKIEALNVPLLNLGVLDRR